jgi:hypothetical protein
MASLRSLLAWFSPLNRERDRGMYTTPLHQPLLSATDLLWQLPLTAAGELLICSLLLSPLRFKDSIYTHAHIHPLSLSSHTHTETHSLSLSRFSHTHTQRDSLSSSSPFHTHTHTQQPWRAQPSHTQPSTPLIPPTTDVSYGAIPVSSSSSSLSRSGLRLPALRCARPHTVYAESAGAGASSAQGALWRCDCQRHCTTADDCGRGRQRCGQRPDETWRGELCAQSE